jgi:uncharacterized RDD family membrane protein YckC
MMPREDPFLQPEQLEELFPVYAGFWPRLAAFLVDTVLLALAGAALGALLGVVMSLSGVPQEWIELYANLLGTLLGLLYYILMESSRRQGTVGKILLGIKVVDYAGGRISVARATARYFARIPSALLLMMGYLMMLWTRRRQTLHDLLCATLVVNESTRPADFRSMAPIRPLSGAAIAAIVAAAVLLPVGGIVAAAAIPAYQHYTVRAQVVQLLALGEEAKHGLEAYYRQSQLMPTRASQIGVADRPSEREVAIGEQGTIMIRAVVPPLAGKSLVFTPVVDDEQRIRWRCHSRDIEERYLPAACRGDDVQESEV